MMERKPSSKMLGMPLIRTSVLLGLVIGLAIFSTSQFRPTWHIISSDSKNAVVASIGARRVTLRELERAAALSLHVVDQQRNTILRSALQDMIDEELLENAAREKATTVTQLLKDASQSTDIARLANLPAPVTNLSLDATQSSHDIQEHTRIRQALLISLRRQTSIDITLPQPELPILSLSYDGEPSLGPPEAPITVLEFSDFQCPYCKLGVSLIKELLQQYPEKIKVVYRDYPGPNHPYALQAAEAAQCAGAQGKFWDYHDLLFSRQVSGSGWDFAALADELKLNSAELMSCLNTGRYRQEVLKDLHDGRKLGISSTPTFFVNGRPLVGARPLAEFKAVIDPLLPH